MTTISDFISACLAVTTPEEARAFYEQKVQEARDAGAADPEDVARANIGWCFGEGMPKERRALWREVCGASHPALGDMVEDPDPRSVLAAGIAHGARLRRAAGAS